jgi:putative hemolysin
MNDEPLPRDILILLLFLLISGFFSLAESALIESRKGRLKTRARENKAYGRALAAAEHPEPFLFTVRIWISLLRIIPGVWGGCRAAALLSHVKDSAFFPFWYWGAIVGTALIITLGVLVFGELIPRQIAVLAPETIAARTVPLILFLEFPLRPFTALIGGCSVLLRRLFRMDPPEPGITEAELRVALLEGEKSGIVESRERTMVEGVFYLGDRPVGTFMTHRSEIAWLELGADRETARKTAAEFRRQGYFPVAAGTLDEVAGIVSVQDILLALLEKEWPPLASIMKTPRFIPETMSALKAFEAFKQEDADFLCVMDEYGGFSGVLSVRDLTEEIVGELSGPDAEEETILRREDGSFLIDGSVNIDEIAGILSIGQFPGDRQEYHTLAGFILELAGEIPKTGAVFEWRHLRFTITKMDGNRIDRVLVERTREAE